MTILVPEEIAAELRDVLIREPLRETGGVLMGEHVGEEIFRIRQITVQRRAGTFARFVRELGDAIGSMRRFFDRTGHNYRVFNYLGEWHSHPSFATSPSTTDCQSMWDIVDDPEVGATFAVLLVVRLNSDKQIDATATAFLSGRQKLSCVLTWE